MDINNGEIWFAKFAFEEDVNQIIYRPVIVLNVETFQVLVLKVTKVNPLKNDFFDLPILYWKEAKLSVRSTAKISKTLYIPRIEFDFKIGDLLEYDFKAIQELFIKFVSIKQ